MRGSTVVLLSVSPETAVRRITELRAKPCCAAAAEAVSDMLLKPCPGVSGGRRRRRRCPRDVATVVDGVEAACDM
jgi:hypothetical protein